MTYIVYLYQIASSISNKIIPLYLFGIVTRIVCLYALTFSHKNFIVLLGYDLKK